jgi:hypothetical protein
VVKGGGADVWGAADAFHFVHQTLAGDGTIVARVASLQNVHRWTKAGLMIRQSAAANAAHVSLFVTPGKGIAFQRRAAAGGASASSTIPGAPPRFLKLARAGKTVTALVSIDGVRWTKVGQQKLAASGPVQAGLAVTSHDQTRRASATFDRVAVSDPATLPRGWRSVDVGQVAIAGSASAARGVFTVAGAGADIWGTADAFQFVHRTARGDGEIVARVASVGSTHRWAKAGVMIRQGESASAPFAMMVVTPGLAVAFQYRTAAGANARSVAGRPSAAPQWVKLVRRGATITGYQSGDGISWRRVGAVDLAVGASTETGLVVTSHDPGALCTAAFDHVTP